MKNIQQQLESMFHDHTIRCTPSGYPEIDRLTGGLVRGGLTLIGARPGMGRTSLMLNIVERLSQKKSGTVLIVSPELRSQAVCIGLMQIGLGLDAEKLLDGSIPSEAIISRCHAFFSSRKSRIQMLTLTWPTLEDIRCCCANIPDLQLVVVDNLEHIHQPLNYFDWNTTNTPPREPMEQVISQLRDLAQNNDVPVIAIATMHRSLENRKDKRPKLQDLKKIHAPESLIDQVIFLYRPRYYYFESDDTAECIVAKTPFGETGTVRLRWFRDTAQFREFPEQ